MYVEGLALDEDVNVFEEKAQQTVVWNGREVAKLDEIAPPGILGALAPKARERSARLRNVEVEPMMAKVGVSHTNANGETTKVEVTIDTRDTQKPASPPPAPPSPPKK